MDLELSVERDGEVPVGTQLVWQLRRLMKDGRLRPGDRLPSLRDAAAAASVNVNTMRAVYARLESEGLLKGEQGRGTFVARRAEDGASRHALRREIARLEAELVRHPPPPLADDAPPARPALLSTADLESIRDELRERLRLLDSQRAELLSRLDQLEATAAEELDVAAPSATRRADVGAPGANRAATADASDRGAATRRSTPSLAGARIRWVGA